MLHPLYEVRSQNLDGSDPWTHQDVTADEESPAHLELNVFGTWSFSVPFSDVALDRLQPIVREVQLWRGAQPVWWGVITFSEDEEDGHRVDCSGLLWWFTRRIFGRAGRRNYLNNGSFDTNTLASWIAVGVTANTVTDWGYKPGSTYQANLYQGGSGTDTFIEQITTLAGGNLWTLSAWFHIRADSTWVGPALDGRGLYIERRNITTDAVEEVQFFAITDETPRGVHQRATVQMYSPPGADSKFIIRLYATRCTDPHPPTGKPPGSIVWDNVQLTLMESTSFVHADLGSVLNGIVTHAQSVPDGKSNLYIGANCPPMGVMVDRTYQHADHMQISSALEEFSSSGLCDIEVKWADDGSSRWLTAYPHQGVVRNGPYDPVLELDAADRVRNITTERDGTKAVTSWIISGQGTGPDKEEANATDTTATGGIVLEEVYQYDEDIPSFDLLAGIGAQKLAGSHLIPKVPKVICSPELIGKLGMGDTVRVYANYGNPARDIDDWFRIVAMDIDPVNDELSLTLNPAPTP